MHNCIDWISKIIYSNFSFVYLFCRLVVMIMIVALMVVCLLSNDDGCCTNGSMFTVLNCGETFAHSFK